MPLNREQHTGEIDDIGRVNRLYTVLSKVNEAIVRIHEPQALYEAACRIAVEDGQFLFAWIGFVEPDTKRVRWTAKFGRDDGYLDKLDLSLDECVPEGRGPTGVALREGNVFVNNDTENSPVMRPWRDEQLKRGFRSSASFPLKTDGRTTGVITLYAGQVGYFDDEEVRLLETLADDFSFALESAETARQRAQAQDALRRSHDELEARVEERTASLRALIDERSRQAGYAEALNRINGSIHSTLDVGEIMDRVVVEIAKALDVDAVIVQTHRGPSWEFEYEYGLPEEMRGLRLADDEAPISMRVRETRQPMVVNDVARAEAFNVTLMERFGVGALMAVPLIMRDQVFGILLAEHFGGPTEFSDEQFDFLQKAAATLALALENARLYEAERDIADRLQGALVSMPEEIAGIEFAHAYHSATESMRVGGDFYDLFELGPEHVGITIGDVSGKGLDAAVLTSMIRNTIRAHATGLRKSPAEVMALTNEVVHDSTAPESFATVFFAILNRRDGRLVYSNAGHTTAAIVRGGGEVVTCAGNGTIIGAFRDADFGESEAHLGTGDLLFLYTDGLTEARREGGMYGEDALLEFLASSQGSADDVVGDVVGDVVSFSQGRLRDDLAILAIRVVG